MWWSQVRADHFVASRRLTIAFEPRSVCGHRVAGPFMTFTSSAMSPSGGSLLPQISDNWAHCQGTSVSRSCPSTRVATGRTLQDVADWGHPWVGAFPLVSAPLPQGYTRSHRPLVPSLMDLANMLDLCSVSLAHLACRWRA
jgi:hypothetical protein